MKVDLVEHLASMGGYFDEAVIGQISVKEVADELQTLRQRNAELTKIVFDSANFDTDSRNKILSQQLTIDKMRDDVSTAFSKVKDLPRFIFLSPADGGVIRFRDPSGNYVEYYEVIKIYDNLDESISIQPSTEELAKHDEELIERCANECYDGCTSCAAVIRKLKLSDKGKHHE